MLVFFSALTFHFMAVPPGMDSLCRGQPGEPIEICGHLIRSRLQNQFLINACRRSENS
jgi:hypothetical protein